VYKQVLTEVLGFLGSDVRLETTLSLFAYRPPQKHATRPNRVERYQADQVCIWDRCHAKQLEHYLPQHQQLLEHLHNISITTKLAL